MYLDGLVASILAFFQVPDLDITVCTANEEQLPVLRKANRLEVREVGLARLLVLLLRGLYIRVVTIGVSACLKVAVPERNLALMD